MNDLISRQAAIDALDKRFDKIPMEQTTEILELRKDLRKLPSAKLEQMTNREDLIRQVNYVILKLNDLRIIAYKLSRDIDDEMNDLGEIKSELEKHYDDKINKMNRYEHGK